MLKSPTKIEYEFSLLNVCSDGVISSMKYEMFWLLTELGRNTLKST